MGKRDSSKTRVAPVLDGLFSCDNTGLSWIPSLLELPCNASSLRPEMNFKIEEACWNSIANNRKEKQLTPPKSLLRWLICHPECMRKGSLSKDPVKANKRKELLEGSQERREEALKLLDNNPHNEDWHIFEGETQPDVFIKTPDLIIVAEGKRTEPKATHDTKWMFGRHQMLRHIDCAWEIKENRKVIGFFIVEGSEDLTIPSVWIEEAGIVKRNESIKSSLPHRSLEEKCGIANCFIGVTTWQRVCDKFKIDWSSLPDAMKY